MHPILRISEAGSLALHAMHILGTNPEKKISTKKLAETLHASEAHLSKVLQRLAKPGFVRSIRGPGGGFVLGKSPERITLLDVLEAIEGPMTNKNCLLANSICTGKGQCILGSLLDDLNNQVKTYFSSTRLSMLKNNPLLEKESVK
ncbi:MAG: Rrf2 family transcriptional regulator [Pseudomonadota bacterium]